MKFLAVFAAALVALTSPAWAAAPAKAKTRAATPARIVLPTNVRPDRYEIHITPDADHLTFKGGEKIALTVLKATDRIVLNAADLEFKAVSLSGAKAAPRTVLDPGRQTAAFVFAKPLAPGRYTLSIAYTGKIYEQASGLFALDYEGKAGKQRALYTQFENSDARRLAPLWDEPGVKAVFALTVDAPAGQMAVSNMPVAQTTPAADGLQSVRFADSPKMSSYLLFMGLGDF
ncbi:hypothetical protein [Phenylobacterium sp.]|uniref:hypothetical protein n=1 Tax=Phenylobacterium sp. TaxID=1871053 RepID=UPI0025DD1E20|nr:hypothetical protein [Phenylobacterium sp.]